jgi:hypothetical protein
MRKYIALQTLACFLLLVSCQPDISHPKIQVLLILNSRSSESFKSNQYLMPYMAHFGIPFDTLDLAKGDLPGDIKKYSLIILGHNKLTNSDTLLERYLSEKLSKSVKKGVGLLSFDPGLSGGLKGKLVKPFYADTLVFSKNNHYITALHDAGENLRLFDSLQLYDYDTSSGEILVYTNGKPFLWSSELGNGRIVHWSSQDWMETRILGPLGGLDDCIWRSMVWAARKPFVLRGLPPVVTMRVDDIAGLGELWHETPLYWVNTCNKYGLKPWLGLFIYNLKPQAVEELRKYIQNSNATASPHAFGRPPRDGLNPQPNKISWKNPKHDLYAGFYYPEALPWRETEYDEFIYFDHQHSRPWNDQEAKRGLEAVDRWYEAHKPLPKSTYFLPHWYETGGNVIEHVSKNWGMEFIAQNKAVDMPWNDSVPWIKQGPFRLYEKPGTSTNNPLRELRGTNPVYYADFSKIDGCSFFNCYTEIRDVAGYEWAPDNKVDSTVNRGIRQLKRALSSMAMAVLFTHESDFIYLIRPENWENEIRLITEGIKSYNPIYLTTDDALKMVRATKTSLISSVNYFPNAGNLTVTLKGRSDIATTWWLFTETNGSIVQKLVMTPAFEGSTAVTTQIK